MLLISTLHERAKPATSGISGPFKQLFISHFLSAIIPLLRVVKLKNRYKNKVLNLGQQIPFRGYGYEKNRLVYIKKIPCYFFLLPAFIHGNCRSH